MKMSIFSSLDSPLGSMVRDHQRFSSDASGAIGLGGRYKSEDRKCHKAKSGAVSVQCVQNPSSDGLCAASAAPVFLREYSMNSDMKKCFFRYIKLQPIQQPRSRSAGTISYGIGQDNAGIRNRESLPFLTCLNEYADIIRRFDYHGRKVFHDFAIDESILVQKDSEGNDAGYRIDYAAWHLYDTLLGGKPRGIDLSVVTVINILSGRKPISPELYDLMSFEYVKKKNKPVKVVKVVQSPVTRDSNRDIAAEEEAAREVFMAARAAAAAQAAAAEPPVDNWEDLLNDE